MTDSDLNRNSDETKDINIASEFSNGQNNYPLQFKLQVSKDKMSAALIILPNDSVEVTYDAILSYLDENHIIYGIDHDEIKNYCNEKKSATHLTVAKGLPAVKGRDAHIMELFKRDRDLIPKEISGGKVDFYNLDFIQNVEKGRILCKKIFATSGKDGFNIFGEVIQSKSGIDKAFLSGQNTIVSEDGSELLAAIDGCLEIKPNRISVLDVVTINGDVDKTCGNIDAMGSVVVTGDVREGFTVKAKGDITIRGMVEGAVINAGGSIHISSGMNGMNKGKIFSGGHINCKFIENSQVACGGNLTADVLINSMVKVKESIILKGSKACIKGGMYQAGLMIYAKEVGTQNSTPTILSIVSDELNFLISEELGKPSNDSDQLKIRLKEIEDELIKIEEITIVLAKNPQTVKTEEIIKNLNGKKNNLTESANLIRKKIGEVKSSDRNILDFKIVVIGTAFPGTRINISHESLILKQEITYTKFFLSKSELQTSLLNPGDRLY